MKRSLKVLSHHQNDDIFSNLFVLEMANNHLGDLNRGRKLIRDHAQIVRQHGVRAAIKLQFRDVDTFIHPDFKGNSSLKYVKKTEDLIPSKILLRK
jgi:sialic acid synthase SpsE